MSRKEKRFRSSFDQGYVPSPRHERISPGRRDRKRSFSESFGNSSFNDDNKYSSPGRRDNKRSFSESFGNSSFNADNKYSSPGRRGHKRSFSERFGNSSFSSENDYSSPAPRGQKRSFSVRFGNSSFNSENDYSSSGRRGHKRSFSERFGNSSFNSDNEYSSPAKFRRLDGKFDTPSKYRGRTDPFPTYLGYQLVGDSLLLRFAEQILFHRCVYSDGLRYLGLCVSGQTIQELTQRVESKFSPLGERIVLLIGTNNMLQGHDIETMKDSLEELLKVLLKSTRKIVMLTLPPIPKLENNEKFWVKFNEYNGFLTKLSKKYDNVFVENICDLYLNGNYECDMDYFEGWFDKLQRRPDRIHLNKSGLVRLRERLWQCETMKD